VQRRAIKLVKNIKHLSYSERIKYLGLPSLQYRRMRSDLVKTYKTINYIDKVDSNTVFPRNESCTRGHKHKIYKKHSRIHIRKYSFSQRVVDTWNKLPANVVDSRQSICSKVN
jgi:hypothetical protein